MWKAHLRGEETSLNPLSMMEALIGAMIHSAVLAKTRHNTDGSALIDFSKKLQSAIHLQMTSPNGGTRDLCGPTGLTTPQFVAAVRARLDSSLAGKKHTEPIKTAKFIDEFEVDVKKMKDMFDSIDTDKSGRINFDEFCVGMRKLGVTPRKLD